MPEQLYNLKISWIFLVWALISSSAEASENYKRIDFNKAGFYLQIPQQWEYDAPDDIYSSLVIIDIVTKPRGEYSDFEAEIEEIEKYKLTLSKTLKESQYYWLQKSDAFKTKSGLEGLKSVYGYSYEKPSAISYFFKNDKEDFIEIQLKFRVWETKEIWKDIDMIILNGLGLE